MYRTLWILLVLLLRFSNLVANSLFTLDDLSPPFWSVNTIQWPNSSIFIAIFSASAVKTCGSVNLGSWPHSVRSALEQKENRYCPRTHNLFCEIVLCSGISLIEQGQSYCSCYSLAGFIGYQLLSGLNFLSVNPAENSYPLVHLVHCRV